LKVKTAIVDQSYLFCSEMGGSQHGVHKVAIMKPLQRGNYVVVQFNGPVDGMKEMTEGGQPFGFEVGERGGDIGEKGNASACSVLRPRYRDAKELTGLGGATPVLEEGLNLTKSLFRVQMAERSAPKAGRTVENKAFSVTVEATFGEDSAHALRLNLM
jgi:hypothetical protein